MSVRSELKLMKSRFESALRTIERDCPPEHCKVIDFTTAEVRALIDDGEEGVGLEILISNLHEVSYPLSAEVHTELQWLVKRLTVKQSYALLLDEILSPKRG